VFEKQGVYGIDCHVNDHRKREFIGPVKGIVERVLQGCKGGKRMSC
jgi:hypothetical protein